MRIRRRNNASAVPSCSTRATKATKAHYCHILFLSVCRSTIKLSMSIYAWSVRRRPQRTQVQPLQCLFQCKNSSQNNLQPGSDCWEKIESELDGTKGAVMFDGWSCNDAHYIAIIASYCTMSTQYLSHTSGIPRLTLLAFALMGKVENDNENETAGNEETATIKAEAHVQLLRDIFSSSGKTSLSGSFVWWQKHKLEF